jgi:hypothetical protein
MMIRKLIHSNVPIATITITPTRAAIGNFSITGAPNRIMINMVNAATSQINALLNQLKD